MGVAVVVVVVVVAAAAAIVVAEAGSESRTSTAAGNQAWWATREALQTGEKARLDLSCCCSWKSGHSRTAEGRRLDE